MNIEQQPYYKTIPTGSEIIYTVFDRDVLTGFKSKYVAWVWISKDAATLGTGSPTTILKVNPNSTGRGIFDFGSIFDNYVHPDYEGGPATFTNISSNISTFKDIDYSKSPGPHAIHVIDDFAGNQNTCNYYYIKFFIETAKTVTGVVTMSTTNFEDTERILIWNAYIDWTDDLYLYKKMYGYKLDTDNYPSGTVYGGFLSDAPFKQYVREHDFMTVGFFNNMKSSAHSYAIEMYSMKINWYYNGSSTFVAARNINNGAFAGGIMDSNCNLQFYGCGPGNLENSALPVPANWDYYTLELRSVGGQEYTRAWEFHKMTDDCKGYETIRLTWLNQWGTWDYYNFTKKSTRTTNKKPVTYNKYGGTWNEKWYTIKGWKGGKRVLNNVANEEITVNTDWITEEESIWLEQLFVSNDVFILNQNDPETPAGDPDWPYAKISKFTQKYLEPVLIKSTTNIRKTKANDKLIQYSLELEKSKRKRIHKG